MTAFLAAAAAIGDVICRSAYWDRDQELCNWMGRSAADLDQSSAAFGPELYGGTSGVALFLAQLFARTGEPRFRRTAVGATARALRQVNRFPQAPKGAAALSFFGGHLGIAYVAHRVAQLTGEPRLSEPVGEMLRIIAASRDEPHALDVIGGNAGAIPILLALGASSSWAGSRALATALGEEICSMATRQGESVVWTPRATSGFDAGSSPLTGYAHGAAGIALALLELHAATGRPEFLETGRRAFAYEDSVFDPERGNWPDYRRHGNAPATSFALAWCHGAPGIALSRLRAMTLEPARSAPLAAVARLALRTTLDTVEQTTARTCPDTTLCHGLAGLNEILWTAGMALDDETYRAAARDTALRMIERHGKAGNWPTGVGGPNPSLMLGTAGIGYHLLRLDAADVVPPVLIQCPPLSADSSRR